MKFSMEVLVDAETDEGAENGEYDKLGTESEALKVQIKALEAPSAPGPPT